jgi:hypothetical protein
MIKKLPIASIVAAVTIAISIPNCVGAVTMNSRVVRPSVQITSDVPEIENVESEGIYDRLAGLSDRTRKAVFHTASASVKADMFRIQIDRFTSAHAVLSPEQRLLLRDARRFISADFYLLDRRSVDWQTRFSTTLAELKSRARQLFATDVASSVFACR